MTRPAPEPARCVAPTDDADETGDPGPLCGEPATTTRLVEGLVTPLCADHARELDDERAAN